LEAARSSDEIPWQHAKVRERAVAELIEGSGPWGERAVTIAQANGVSQRTLYRWLSGYRDSATTSSLIPLPDGAPRGARRLDPTRETLVNKIIEQQYLSRTRPSIQEIVRLVARRCIEDGCKPISRNAIRARIRQIDPRTHIRARFGVPYNRPWSRGTSSSCHTSLAATCPNWA
jgi:putative transposase